MWLQGYAVIWNRPPLPVTLLPLSGEEVSATEHALWRHLFPKRHFCPSFVASAASLEEHSSKENWFLSQGLDLHHTWGSQAGLSLQQQEVWEAALASQPKMQEWDKRVVSQGSRDYRVRFTSNIIFKFLHTLKGWTLNETEQIDYGLFTWYMYILQQGKLL